jgi:phosphate transport system substrate-binding protein
VFLQAFMGDMQPMRPEKDLVIGSMSELLDQVASYDNARNALGYTMYYYVANMYTVATIRVLSVDGVPPSTETIATGAYPLCTAYCAVLRADTPADHPARKLVAWLLSPEGQRVAVDAGYAPLEPVPAAE